MDKKVKKFILACVELSIEHNLNPSEHLLATIKGLEASLKSYKMLITARNKQDKKMLEGYNEILEELQDMCEDLKF